jgi:hypothetical protein
LQKSEKRRKEDDHRKRRNTVNNKKIVEIDNVVISKKCENVLYILAQNINFISCKKKLNAKEPLAYS